MTDAVQQKETILNGLDKSNTDWLRALVEWSRDILVSDTLLIGEDIRHIIEPLIGPPSHPNVWGAAIRRLVKEGVLEETDLPLRAMKDIKSNARRSIVYRVR